MSRSHLLTKIEKGLNGKLTIVSAPAGYGKSSLLAEWARQSHYPVAWLSLDATNQVRLNQKDTAVWRKGGSIPDFAADIYDSLMASWGVEEIEMWDLVTAEIMMNPQHCNFTPLAREIVTEEGQSEGQTRVIEGGANVNVYLEPDSDAIKQTLTQVFSSRK
ncbi:MAG: hypothetical protein JXA38_03360 [Methanosarcinaceae archaeon]|nr:hypothetical protein [Methanosarcinaceae archaeon]